VIACGDSLGQLAQIVPFENVLQFRLADEDNLQQLFTTGLQVGQQPDLLENFNAEVLGLINDQDRVSALGVGFKQETENPVDQQLCSLLFTVNRDTTFGTERG